MNDIRDMHTDFEPTFENTEDIYLFGFTYDFDSFSVGLLGAYQETEYVARQDYLMDVGVTLEPSVLNPTGFYPTSEVNGDFGAGFKANDTCNWAAGTAGIWGGCQHAYADTTRVFAFDHASAKGDSWNIEAKVSSSFDGRFNFIVGASTYESNSDGGDYYVNANTLDLVGTQGVPLLGFPPLYPTMFDVPGDSDYKTADGYAVFGEIYFDVTDTIKLTAGLRYNEDNKETSSTSVLYNAVNLNAILGGALGPDPYWTRNTNWMFGVPQTEDELIRNEFYGASDAFAAASLTVPLSPERFAADQLIPITPAFNETRFVTGSPDEETWDEVTGRIGVDWQWSDDSMVYAFFSRGYKPGGFNPPINPTFQDTSSFTFDSEEIDSFEIGSKNILMDGRLMLNASVFIYDYTGLQVVRIRNNSALNDNIDVEIWGLEFEGFWSPEALPNLSIDWAYSYLDTSVDGSTSLDPVNRTAGDPDFVVLKNIDAGSLTAVTYIAPISEVDAAVVTEGLFPSATCSALAPNTRGTGSVQCPFGMLSALNGTTVSGVTYTSGPEAGIPAYTSRTYLDNNGVSTSEGNPTDLDGNQLPNSPENTIHLGAAYTWNIDVIRGALTARWDYYWQDESYAREFNARGDEIDDWDQHNASLIYESNNGSWKATAWIRNIEDEDNVTGKYLTSDTSGFFRNYFLTEPRVYGASVRYAFGAN
jgi:outer membrane receptor protein involved in Fe transport